MNVTAKEMHLTYLKKRAARSATQDLLLALEEKRDRTNEETRDLLKLWAPEKTEKRLQQHLQEAAKVERRYANAKAQRSAMRMAEYLKYLSDKGEIDQSTLSRLSGED